ncbi:MAG: Rv2175c family DNA-binding protein [Marmoricola sp.]
MDADDNAGEDSPGKPAALAGLVGAWLDWAAAATELGLGAGQVRRLVQQHRLAAAVPEDGTGGTGVRIPAELIMDGAIVKGLPGTLTVLHDGGLDDPEALAWLFTPDDSLPGRPIDALRENRGTEVKRRAQAMAL